MANAKLSGSLLSYKGPPSPTTPEQRLSPPSEVFVDRSLENHFETVGSASGASDSTDGPVLPQVAAAGRSGASSQPNGNDRSRSRVHFALAVCGITAMAVVGVFLFVRSTAQTGPTFALQSGPVSPSLSDTARVRANPVVRLHTIIGASGKASKGAVAPVSVAPPNASVQPAITAAIANPALPPAEATPASGPPGPSAEPRVAVASASDRIPAIGAAPVLSPTQPVIVLPIATPPAAPEPPPAAVMAPTRLVIVTPPATPEPPPTAASAPVGSLPQPVIVSPKATPSTAVAAPPRLVIVPPIATPPAVVAAPVESPTRLLIVPSIATPPTAVAAPISPQPAPAIASRASGPPTRPAGVRIPAEEVAALLARGDALFGVGDIASARLFYQRAAEEGGDAEAALRLGETYDPAFLASARVNGVSGDAAAAARWYLYARQLGSAKAEFLLTGLAAGSKTAKQVGENN